MHAAIVAGDEMGRRGIGGKSILLVGLEQLGGLDRRSGYLRAAVGGVAGTADCRGGRVPLFGRGEGERRHVPK